MLWYSLEVPQQKHMLWYSLEAPQRGASNEYHNICFRREIRKISAFFGWKKRLICCYGKTTIIWYGLHQKKVYATRWENIPSDICTQWRLKSSCPSSQSDQSLHCLHEETLHLWLSKMHSVKILMGLQKCAGWSESSLGAHVQRYAFWLYSSHVFSYPLSMTKHAYIILTTLNSTFK